MDIEGFARGDQKSTFEVHWRVGAEVEEFKWEGEKEFFQAWEQAIILIKL